MVASTKPSTTKVSQSVISTPLSLMLGPTVSLLPPSGAELEWAGAEGVRSTSGVGCAVEVCWVWGCETAPPVDCP